MCKLLKSCAPPTVTDPMFGDYKYFQAQLRVKKNQKNPKEKIGDVNYETLEKFYKFQDEQLKKRVDNTTLLSKSTQKLLKLSFF